MIESIDTLKNILEKEFRLYFQNRKSYIRGKLLRERNCTLWKYQRAIRYLEYYASHSGWSKKWYYAYYSRKVNRLGFKLGIEMWHSCFAPGLRIYHSEGIVVNSHARIGMICKLHGCNCIGNKGEESGAPVIGDNCNIGFGASIIGPIRIGNNVTIAAGAVVCNSFAENNVILAGVPARIVKKYE